MEGGNTTELPPNDDVQTPTDIEGVTEPQHGAEETSAPEDGNQEDEEPDNEHAHAQSQGETGDDDATHEASAKKWKTSAKGSPQSKQLPVMDDEDRRLHLLVVNEGLVYREYYKRLSSENEGIFKVTVVSSIELVGQILQEPFCRISGLLIDLRDGIKRSNQLQNLVDARHIRLPVTLIVKSAAAIDEDNKLRSCIISWARRMTCLVAEFPFSTGSLATKLHLLIEHHRKSTDLYEGVRTKSILRDMGRYKNEHRANWMKEQTKYASMDGAGGTLEGFANMDISPRSAASKAASAVTRKQALPEKSYLRKGSSVLETPSIFAVSIEDETDEDAKGSRFRGKIAKTETKRREPIKLDGLEQLPFDVEEIRRDYAIEHYLKYRNSTPSKMSRTPSRESGRSESFGETKSDTDIQDSRRSLDAQWTDPLRSNAVKLTRVVSAKDIRRGMRRTSVLGNNEVSIRDVFNSDTPTKTSKLSGNTGVGILYSNFVSGNDEKEDRVEKFVKMMEDTDSDKLDNARRVLSRLSYTRSRRELLKSEERARRGETFATEEADSAPMHQVWEEWMGFDILRGDVQEPSMDNVNDCSPAFKWIMRGVGKLYGTDSHEEADNLFTQAIKSDKKCSTAFHMRAVARIKMGQWEAALQDLDASLLHDPSDIAGALLEPHSHKSTSALTTNMGNPNNPLTKIVGTNFPAGKGGINRSYEQSEKLKKCREYGSAVVTATYLESRGEKKSGSRSRRNDNSSNTAEWQAKLRSMYSHESTGSIVRALFNRAYVFSALGDHFAALDDLNDTLRLDSSFQPALKLRAMLKRRQGDELGASQDYLQLYQRPNAKLSDDSLLSSTDDGDPETLRQALDTLNISLKDRLIDTLGLRQFLLRSSKRRRRGSYASNSMEQPTGGSQLMDEDYDRSKLFKDLIITAAAKSHDKKDPLVQSTRDMLMKEATSEQRKVLKSLPLPGSIRVPAGNPANLPWNKRKNTGSTRNRRKSSVQASIGRRNSSEYAQASAPTESHPPPSSALDLSDVVSGSKDVYSSIVCRPTDAQKALRKATRERKKDDIDAIKDMMHSLLFFRSLDRQTQHELARSLLFGSYKDTETICEEAEDFPYFCMIMTGQVLARISVPTGDVRTFFVVDNLCTGDYFGDLTMLFGPQRTLWCTSIGPNTELLFLHKEDFYRVGLDKKFLENIRSKRDTLRHSNGFQQWNDNDLFQLACVSRVKTFQKHEAIITQNSIPSNFFVFAVLMKGSCTVYRSGDALDLEKRIKDTEEELEALKYAGAYHRGMRHNAIPKKSQNANEMESVSSKHFRPLRESTSSKDTFSLSEASTRMANSHREFQRLDEESRHHRTLPTDFKPKTKIDEERKRTEGLLQRLKAQLNKLYERKRNRMSYMGQFQSSRSLRSSGKRSTNRLHSLSKQEARLRKASSKLLRSNSHEDDTKTCHEKSKNSKDRLHLQTASFSNLVRFVDHPVDSPEESPSETMGFQDSFYSTTLEPENEHRLLVDTLYPPAIFGELAVLSPWDGYEKATIYAETYCETLCIPKSVIDHSMFTDERKEDIRRRTVVYPDEDDILKQSQAQKQWRGYKKKLMDTISKSKWPVDKNKIKTLTEGRQIIMED